MTVSFSYLPMSHSTNHKNHRDILCKLTHSQALLCMKRSPYPPTPSRQVVSYGVFDNLERTKIMWLESCVSYSYNYLHQFHRTICSMYTQFV